MSVRNAVIDELIREGKKTGRLSCRAVTEALEEAEYDPDCIDMICGALADGKIEMTDEPAGAEGGAAAADPDAAADIDGGYLGVYLRETGKIQPVTPEEEAELGRRLAAGDQSVRQRIAESHLSLVVSIARQYEGRGADLLDLIQEGNIGLSRAVQRFGSVRGARFSTFAAWWIRQAIAAAVADRTSGIRIPVHMVSAVSRIREVIADLRQESGSEPGTDEIAQAAGMTEEQVLRILRMTDGTRSAAATDAGEEQESTDGEESGSDYETPAETSDQAFLMAHLREVVSTMTPREEKILRVRFGLDDGRVRTLDEAARELKVPKEKIRQTEAKAIRKIRYPSRGKRLRDYLD